jgi:DNA-binding CsgD family transcriptional regulator
MDNELADFLTRLIALRRNALDKDKHEEQAIEAFYRFLADTGIERCNFGGWQTDETGGIVFNEFGGTSLPPGFVEEYSAELVQDDYILRNASLLSAERPVAKFGVGVDVLDEVEAVHAPGVKVMAESVRHGMKEGIALVGNIASPGGAGRHHYGFCFAGEKGTRARLIEKDRAIEIATYALLDQIMPKIEATIDGFDQPLTVREREVLCALAQGDQRKGIAFRLNLSLPTVDLHLTNLKRKLSATTLAEAVSRGYRYGIL